MKLLGNLPKGLLFVISAPAGTGKTTLADMLEKEFPCVHRNISYTTRAPRAGEVDGKDYIFISKEEFEKKIARGEFLDHVTLYGNYYGTSSLSVKQWQDEGKHVLLVIDTQGAVKLKKELRAIFIFLQPPSLQVLKNRLVGRKTENAATIEERLAWAEEELKKAYLYDYIIENDDLDRAYQILRSILIAEEHRAVHN